MNKIRPVAQWMTLVVSGGVYNPRRGTCGVNCIWCNGYSGFCVVLNPFAVAVTATTPLHSQATYSNGNVYDYTSSSSWRSDATQVATVGTSTGVVTGQAPGSANVYATFPSLIVTTGDVCSGGTPICPTGTPSPGSPGNVTPTITGLQTVWWFNGQYPSGYATTITLTASPAGGSSYSWSMVTSGSGRAVFNVKSGNAITLSGSALSSPAQDIGVQVTVTTAAGTGTSATYAFTVQGPKTLVPGAIQYACDTNTGYHSQLFYTLKDNLGKNLPSDVGYNETFTTADVNDMANNWPGGPPGGETTSASVMNDYLAPPFIGNPDIPMPTCPASPPGSTKVVHNGQEWRVGTATPGQSLGARVQTDTIQFYLDHARHLAIISPAP